MASIDLYRNLSGIAHEYLDALYLDIPTCDLQKDISLLGSFERECEERTPEYRFFHFARQALEFWKESLEDPAVTETIKRPVVQLHPELLDFLEKLLEGYERVDFSELSKSKRTLVYRIDYAHPREVEKTFSIACKCLSPRSSGKRGAHFETTSAHSEIVFSLTNLEGYNHPFAGLCEEGPMGTTLFSRVAKKDFFDFLASGPSDGELAKNLYYVAKTLKKSFDYDFCPADLKLENILIFDEEPFVLLCDNGEVGLAGEPRKQFTQPYRPPESISSDEPLSKEQIMWQFGVILANCIARRTLFEESSPGKDCSQEDIQNYLFKVFSRVCKFPLSRLQIKGIHLVTLLLKVNPDERLTIEETLSHPYFSLFNTKSLSKCFVL